MAIRSICCNNLPLPKIKPIPSTPKSSRVSLQKDEKWRARCAIGVACMVIGMELGDIITIGKNEAIAEEMELVLNSNKRDAKWSDKRVCPSWKINSLETIVPENLPRPFARRRWELVGWSEEAPVVKASIIRTNNNCFTM